MAAFFSRFERDVELASPRPVRNAGGIAPAWLGVPPGMSATLVHLSAIPLDTKVHSITKEQRKALVQLLKALPATIASLMGFDLAIVADGGVPLTEVDTKTMRSLRCENLYITGDLLHIRRPSGGFSLQLCWTTGVVAGEHC